MQTHDHLWPDQHDHDNPANPPFLNTTDGFPDSAALVTYNRPFRFLDLSGEIRKEVYNALLIARDRGTFRPRWLENDRYFYSKSRAE